MYFVALHGHGTSFSPGASGLPTECTHGTNSPSVPSTSTTARPMRVMMRMLTTTYGTVGNLDPDLLRCELPKRAHRKWHDVHRAAAHAAGEQPVQRRRASRAGVDPVVRRAGVVLRFRCR